MREKKPRNAHNWQRNEDEWYVEPIFATRLLLAHIAHPKRAWDPCCGKGNVIKALLAANIDAIGTDLRNRFRGDPPDWFLGQHDFFSGKLKKSPAPAIICNPPYGEDTPTERFVRTAMELRGLELLAVFVEFRFLGSGGRATGLFRQFPPHKVVTVSPRPSCPPGEYIEAGNEPRGGSQDFCWIVWKPQELGISTIEFGFDQEEADRRGRRPAQP